MDLVLDKLQRLVYVDSSNPCWLYLDLSRAVHQKDVGSRLIRDLKAQMLRSIGSSSLPAADAHNFTTPDPPARNIGSRRNEPRRFALAEGGKKGVFFG